MASAPRVVSTAVGTSAVGRPVLAVAAVGGDFVRAGVHIEVCGRAVDPTAPTVVAAGAN